MLGLGVSYWDYLIYYFCDCRFLCLGFRVQIWDFEVPTMRNLINSILPQSVVPIRDLELQTLGGCQVIVREELAFHAGYLYQEVCIPGLLYDIRPI